MIEKDITYSQSGYALCALCRDEGKVVNQAHDIYIISYQDGKRKATSVCISHATKLDQGLLPYQGKNLIWGINESRLDSILRELDI